MLYRGWVAVKEVWEGKSEVLKQVQSASAQAGLATSLASRQHEEELGVMDLAADQFGHGKAKGRIQLSKAEKSVLDN